MQTTSTPEPVKQNIWWLIKHAWNIIFKHNSWNERISKWEKLVASMLLGVIWVILAMLTMVLWWWSRISIIWVVIIYIAVIYYLLKLLKQRFNDLNLWAKGMRRTIGWIIATIILWVIAWLVSTQSIILSIIFGICALISLSFVLWYKLLAQFENGSQWENNYGTDPMLRQPLSNRPYIIFGAIVPAIIYLILIIIVLASWALINKAWINPSMLWWSAMMPHNNMMKQNFDSSMTEDQINQQIDDAIQTEDRQAITKTTTATGN
jgi:hypothetical protein